MVRARDPALSQPGFFAPLEGLCRACRAQGPGEQPRGPFPGRGVTGTRTYLQLALGLRGIGAGEGWKGFLNLLVGMGK